MIDGDVAYTCSEKNLLCSVDNRNEVQIVFMDVFRTSTDDILCYRIASEVPPG